MRDPLSPLSLPRSPPTRQPDFSLATVNIVLLLVLFFLVVGSPAGESERALALPETRTLPQEALPRPLLAMQPGGELQLDGLQIDRDEIVTRIRDGGLPVVHLLVPRDLAALQVLALTDLISGVGARVVMVTLRLGELSPRGAADLESAP